MLTLTLQGRSDQIGSATTCDTETRLSAGVAVLGPATVHPWRHIAGLFLFISLGPGLLHGRHQFLDLQFASNHQVQDLITVTVVSDR